MRVGCSCREGAAAHPATQSCMAGMLLRSRRPRSSSLIRFLLPCHAVRTTSRSSTASSRLPTGLFACHWPALGPFTCTSSGAHSAVHQPHCHPNHPSLPSFPPLQAAEPHHALHRCGQRQSHPSARAGKAIWIGERGLSHSAVRAAKAHMRSMHAGS